MASFTVGVTKKNPFLYARSRSTDTFLKILQFSFIIPFYSIRQTMKLLFHPRIACLYKFEIHVVNESFTVRIQIKDIRMAVSDV